ncbi:MAG: (2Fe-2S) ferredoxin domain-containing protein [Planctomycetota bacterium]|nr:(2Fe-2S) ferredoxin domain-containing protein [Planctomycetota bacterium]
MSDKVEIAICMGSSCFARGNNIRLEALEDMVKARNWENRVFLLGLRCENRCSAGPNLKIDGELYQNLDVGALIDVIEAKLGGKPAAGTGGRLENPGDG